MVFKSKAEPMPTPCKGTEAPPSDYKGGRVYWKINRKTFRVIRKMPKYETEKPIKWTGDEPTKKEWNAALSAIDNYKE